MGFTDRGFLVSTDLRARPESVIVQGPEIKRAKGGMLRVPLAGMTMNGAFPAGCWIWPARWERCDERLAKLDCVRRIFVGGAWIGADSGKTIDVTNPATGEVIGTVPACGEAETMRANRRGGRGFRRFRGDGPE